MCGVGKQSKARERLEIEAENKESGGEELPKIKNFSLKGKVDKGM